MSVGDSARNSLEILGVGGRGTAVLPARRFVGPGLSERCCVATDVVVGRRTRSYIGFRGRFLVGFPGGRKAGVSDCFDVVNDFEFTFSKH
jgi:hypothetical protein